jgi:ATP-binding cassette subfamily B protein
MVVSVALLFAGRASVGAYAALFSAVESFQFGYQRLLWETFLVYEDLRYVEDFFDFVDQPAPPLDSGARLPSPLRQGIVFEDVSFAYPGATQPALASVSFTIRPGERIALVGENGAGKSTLVKLLMGLYRPSSGRILIDGADLRDLALDGWYARLGAVFQQFNRYQATVRENVAFGWIAALDDVAQIEVAMHRSGADAVAAALPAGINTPLGKEFWDGAELSTGQWQKLAIARAYVRPAELLVLDEPASALDAQAEADVYEHFARLATASTVILISHRLGSCRIAQRILVLKDGRLCEEGTHAELLAAGSVYADLYRLQAAWYR